MKYILNLTGVPATPEQVFDGVIELANSELKERLVYALSFGKVPLFKEVEERAELIEDIFVEDTEIRTGLKLKEISENSGTPTLRHSDTPPLCSKPQEKIHRRRGEQDAVEDVEQAAHAGDDAAGILDAGGALEEGFGQVADHAADGQEDAEGNGADPRQAEGRERVAQRPDVDGADRGAEGDAAEDAFPRLGRGNARDELVAAAGAADQIGADVRELGGEHGVEQEPPAWPINAAGEVQRPAEQQQLGQEVPQQAHVEDAEQRAADGPQRVRIVLLRELADEDADGDQEQHDGIPRTIGRTAVADAGDPRDEHERDDPDRAVGPEVRHAARGHHLVELQRHDGRQRRQHERDARVGHEEERGEQDAGDGKSADEAMLDGGLVHEGAP